MKPAADINAHSGSHLPPLIGISVIIVFQKPGKGGRVHLYLRRSCSWIIQITGQKQDISRQAAPIYSKKVSFKELNITWYSSLSYIMSNCGFLLKIKRENWPPVQEIWFVKPYLWRTSCKPTGMCLYHLPPAEIGQKENDIVAMLSHNSYFELFWIINVFICISCTYSYLVSNIMSSDYSLIKRRKKTW